MPTVAISELQPGAVLSHAIHSPRGVLLAPAGTVVTEAHLALFTSWGVREAEISGDNAPHAVGARQIDDAEIEAVQQLLDERFSTEEELSPFMQEVRRVAEHILIQRLYTQAQPEEHARNGSQDT